MSGVRHQLRPTAPAQPPTRPTTLPPTASSCGEFDPLLTAPYTRRPTACHLALPSPLRRALLTLGVVALLAPTPASARLIPPPGLWPTTVAGAINPLRGTPFMLNGANATANAQLRVWFSSHGRRLTALTRTAGFATRIGGRLLSRDNHHSIAGATLTLAQQNVYTPDAWTVVSTVQADREGRFHANVPPGYHRRIAVLYYPSVDAVSPIVSRRLLLRAKSRVTLRRPLHRRRAYRCDGQVRAGALVAPGGGLLIGLQVRNSRGNWITARLARTAPSGQFRIRYTFPSAGTLRVRVLVPAQNAWPLYAGTSHTYEILPR